MELPFLPEQCSRHVENRVGGRHLVWLAAVVLSCLFFLVPAEANLPYETRVNLTKSVDDVRDNNDSTFSVRFTLVARNTGNEALRRLEIEDALDFIDPSLLVDIGAVEVVGGEVTVNAGYDGVEDIALLVGSDGLAVAAEVSLQFEIQFRPRR